MTPTDLQKPPTETEIADIARLPDPISGVIRRLAFQRDTLIARVRELEAGLPWTDAKPTVPGPYWVEDGGEEVVTVFEIDGELRVYVPGVRYSISLDEFCRRAGGRRLRFAGPIPTPKEPR